MNRNKRIYHCYFVRLRLYLLTVRLYNAIIEGYSCEAAWMESRELGEKSGEGVVDA